MIEIVHDIKDADFITHKGVMHADDVFATAFLHLYKKKEKVARVGEVDVASLKEESIVYDIGKKEFDHHQENAKVRENGIKYSSFGLLWKSFGRDFLKERNMEDEQVFSSFDKDFVMAIDAIDNGVFPNIEADYKVKTLSDIIKLFNPAYQSGKDESIQFVKAVELAISILEEELSYVAGKVKAKDIVLEKMKEQPGPILILDSYLPYEEVLLTNPLGEKFLFVLYPSNRGDFAVKCLPVSLENHKERLLFPSSWAGKTKEELEKVTKVKGAIFCHINRFLVTARTKELALKLAREAMKEKE